ncbi:MULTISPECIES: DUF2017 domain-containing protein [Corynebacterium]|uniref:Uncharacterized protein n=1 Tax=Corynebacterium auriscanis TaxID=99807 RepID=A0A0A2DKD7_9CORY|nr:MULTISPECIES: DUF2017 domain-containing protein [Corynebacterium]KGM18237.1 hypothetical protein MA47_09165 [Corynebacterium auriscanis]MCX2163305.1 DUF2017 domain-containing protein [Corynebacterium auriscanis]OFT87326.1 hypothetical protein HMPREF3098_09990 [Corynebacterium sp. HMSC28B08]WJY72259.1 hypothetical protein CAURIC_02970 [Corynebacterium auriscanis]
MQPWAKKKSVLRGTRYVTVLEPIEREMLGDSAATVSDKLMERVRTAPKDELAELTGMPSGHAEAPHELGLRRMLPSFFKDDAELMDGDAALMRQLHETDIIKRKLLNLQYVVTMLGPNGSVNISLSPDEVQPWLGALADIRQYHTAQLEEFRVTLEDNSDQLIAASNYLEWLGYHLDSLLTAVMGELDVPDEGADGQEDTDNGTHD